MRNPKRTRSHEESSGHQIRGKVNAADASMALEEMISPTDRPVTVPTNDLDTAILEAVAARGSATGPELLASLRDWPGADVIEGALTLSARGRIVPRDGAFVIGRAA